MHQITLRHRLFCAFMVKHTNIVAKIESATGHIEHEEAQSPVEFLHPLSKRQVHLAITSGRHLAGESENYEFVGENKPEYS